MKIGDKILASWTDGLVLSGKYLRNERGYIILLDESGKEIVCNRDAVKFTVLNPTTSN